MRGVVRRPVVLAASLWLLAGVARGQATSDWSSSPAVGLGPLLLRAQSPLTILRLTPTPDSPATLAPGQWQIGVLTSWNNYFDVDERGRYVIDAEALRFSCDAAYGIAPGVDVRVALPVSYRGGGILDGFVQWFEGVVGVVNDERRRYPRNQFLIRIRGDDGQVFERNGAASGWGLEDTTATVRFQLAPGTTTTPAVLATLGIKVPTGRHDSLHSSNGVDVEAGVSAGQRLSRKFHVYTSASFIRYATDQMLGVELHRTQWSLFSGVEYRHSPRTSYLLQALVTSAGAVDLGDFAKPTYEMTFGFKHRIGRQWLLEASVLENLLVFRNSPDVGFHLGLVWHSWPTTTLRTR